MRRYGGSSLIELNMISVNPRNPRHPRSIFQYTDMKTALVGGLVLRLLSLPIRRRRVDSSPALEGLPDPYMNDAMRTSKSGVCFRNEGWRIDEVPVIDADRTDGRVKTQPEPNGV
jgi:hypothetical protein